MPDAVPAPPSMPPRSAKSRASVARGFVDGMLAGMLRRGIEPAPLLLAAGIDVADSASRIPLDRYAALYNLIVLELADEGFGLFAAPLRPGAFEFLCRGMIGAATLAEALDRARRFLAVVLPDLAVGLSRGDERACISIAETRPLAAHADDPGRVFAFEWLLRLIHGLACWFAGRGIGLDAVAFPYPRPAHADDYALVYTERSTFDAPRLEAHFRAHLLDLPVRRDEAALADFLAGAPGKISVLYRRDRAMVLRVRDLLRAALPDTLSQDEVAAKLHLSPRTLHRRLDEEGASFRSIKDALRRDIALGRLAKTPQPIARLAADLGYADTSTFYRAFLSWTGMSPEQYRRQLHGGPERRTLPAAPYPRRP